MKFAWLITLIALFGAGCGTATAPSNTALCQPTEGVPVEDLNPNPAFRAGSVVIWNREYQGHGFIYESAGKLYFGTIEHVAKLAQGECAFALVPGTKHIGILTYGKFEFHGQGDDRFAYYLLSDQQTTLARGDIAAGIFRPLVLSSTNPSALIAIPRGDTGRYTYYRNPVREGPLFVATTDGLQGVVCEGRSGGPILSTTSGGPTTSVVGVVSAVRDLAQDSSGLTCGYTLLFSGVN